MKTIQPDGTRQTFAFYSQGDFHEFKLVIKSPTEIIRTLTVPNLMSMSIIMTMGI